MNVKVQIGSIFALFLMTATGYAETSRVIVKEAVIRRDCSFVSPSVARVKYDEQVEIVSKTGDWLKVNVGSTEGCVHKDAVEKKSFSLSGIFGSKSEGPSKEEIALAGKGFTPEVEHSYRSKYPNLDFDAVDQIEKHITSDEALTEFFKAGGLNIPK